MDRQDVYNIFDSNGLLSASISSFEFRESQLNMALDCFDTYSESSIACIEAGTGVGKSLAYLAPALFYAFENPKDRTVIATSTINLQKQLLEKDLPALFKVFGKQCNVAIAVGRQNYICKRRLNIECSSNSLMLSDDKSELSKLNNFANISETGLKSDYNGKLDYQLWNSICSDSDFCIGNNCPFFSECFYFKAKKKLVDSSVIICNHHLLFVDSNTRLASSLDYSQECILPSFKRLVIDESHNIERHATDLFTSQFSSAFLRRQLDYIHDDRFHGSAVKILEELSPLCSDVELYSNVVKSFNLVNTSADTLNMVVLSFLDSNLLTHILITKENAPKILGVINDTLFTLLEDSRCLLARLTEFASKIKCDEDTIQRVADLNIHIGRVKEIMDVLADFADWKNWADDVHYIETERRANIRYAVFKKAPLDVAPVLRDALFRKIDSVVCTSATLDLKDNFSYFCSNVGLPIEKKKFIKRVYSSPFDYKNRLMLLTPYDSPDYKNDRQQEYADFLCSFIYDCVSSSGGGSLVLFTSNKLMEYVYTLLKPRFEALELNCLKQGDMDRFALLETFKNDTDSVLFATDSFWEGVDAPGNTLRMVIITKLPFRMPDEPIYRARYAKLEKEGKSGFYCLSLPDATMKLKQGFGRLMRHTTDKGIVVISDSRIVSKSYGAMMLSSLPESYHPETAVSTIGQKIESFLF